MNDRGRGRVAESTTGEAPDGEESELSARVGGIKDYE